METHRQLWRRKLRLYPPNKEIWVRRRPRGCHWTSSRARPPCGRKSFNTYPSLSCDSLLSNYQCPALRWIYEHICVDRRQIISSSHMEALWSLWFQFLHRLRNQVLEGLAYLPCCAELLQSKVFSNLSIPSVDLCWPDTSLCPSSPTHTKGICHFFWARLLVKPCSPPILKWISPWDDSISISQRQNYIWWWNKEKSRLKEKVSINS